ncbi:pyruvate formate-lyase-activating protein [uncultured Propionibacterium sp.]|uniref:pyruvate formate-lyase-activating protein n=1 Tax=uncultured Propionibacterium sp. TaxID=218066 RepID=UPI00292F77E9|nr:pyruvate formate-lyase-activating protein [uncultured Propionibacterium sp.]
MTADTIAPVGDNSFRSPIRRLHGAGLDGVTTEDLPRGARLEAMHTGTAGSIHSWELVTAVDGPGTRMTVFFAGCPLRCQYCHNPDTFFMARGQLVAVDDMLGRIGRYRGVFRATGGGLTLSGGEVLMQASFAANLLRGARTMGVHTCIDTSGFLGAACTDEMLDDIDLVLLDVKSGDPDLYKEVTGRALAPTLAFGDRLAAKGTEAWIRFVDVPGLTDDPANVAKVADIVAGWPNVTRTEVLGFHQMGRDKWHDLGLDYRLENTPTPSKDELEAARATFRERGLKVF